MRYYNRYCHLSGNVEMSSTGGFKQNVWNCLSQKSHNNKLAKISVRGYLLIPSSVPLLQTWHPSSCSGVFSPYNC